jgi:GNAT superfamily N-acetyltransferase
MPDASIRPINEGDYDGWKPLWDGYLRFYREDLDDETTRFTFERMWNQSDGMFGFVADTGDELVGFVHALTHPSTWTTKSYCYLEDLFVSKSTRGTDVARELIESVVKEARSRGAVHTYWHTQEFNGAARSLYDQVAHLTSFRVYEK